MENEEIKNEYRTKNAKEEKSEIPLTFCKSGCKVCSSGHLEYINQLRQSGKGYVEISEALKNEKNYNLSKDIIWRHFKNYNKKLQLVTTEKMLAQFDEKSETVAKHQKETLFLIHKTFDNIVQHLEAGTLILGVGEYEKLVNLYYKTLRDPDRQDDDSYLAIFQKASHDLGINLEQGILFKK